jgi:hypothetical protein
MGKGNHPQKLPKALDETREQAGAGTLGGNEIPTTGIERQAGAALRKEEAVKTVPWTTNARGKRTPRINKGRLCCTLSQRTIKRRTSTRRFTDPTRIATWTLLFLSKYRIKTYLFPSKTIQTSVSFYSAWVKT